MPTSFCRFFTSTVFGFQHLEVLRISPVTEVRHASECPQAKGPIAPGVDGIRNPGCNRCKFEASMTKDGGFKFHFLNFHPYLGK